MMLFRRHRMPKKPEHPTPWQALDALSEGRCLYAAISNCSKRPPSQRGLRDEEDNNVVLVCGGPYPRLRHMPTHDLNRLERVLLEAFRSPTGVGA